MMQGGCQFRYDRMSLPIMSSASRDLWVPTTESREIRQTSCTSLACVTITMRHLPLLIVPKTCSTQGRGERSISTHKVSLVNDRSSLSDAREFFISEISEIGKCLELFSHSFLFARSSVGPGYVGKSASISKTKDRVRHPDFLSSECSILSPHSRDNNPLGNLLSPFQQDLTRSGP